MNWWVAEMPYEIDVSDVEVGQRWLAKGFDRIPREAKKVITKTALQGKKGMVKTLRGQLGGAGREGGSSLWMLPLAISYDLLDGGWTAEIGPDQSLSGLGKGAELGSSKHGPIPFAFQWLVEEEPKMLDGFKKAIQDAFTGA